MVVDRFNESAGGPSCEAICLDALSLDELPALTPGVPGGFGLVLAPMLFAQTLGSVEALSSTLKSVPTILIPGGILALSIDFDLPVEPGLVERGERFGTKGESNLRVESLSLTASPERVGFVRRRSFAGPGQTAGSEYVAEDLLRLARDDLDAMLEAADLEAFDELTVEGDPATPASSVVLARRRGLRVGP